MIWFKTFFFFPSERLSPEIVIVEDDTEDEDTSNLSEDRNAGMIGPLSPVREDISSPLMSGPLQLNNQSSFTAEDPVTMMDSILNESGVLSQNINLLGKLVKYTIYVYLWCLWFFCLFSYLHHENNCGFNVFNFTLFAELNCWIIWVALTAVWKISEPYCQGDSSA